MTGRRPDTTQVYDLQKHFRTVLPDVVTLSQLFRTTVTSPRASARSITTASRARSAPTAWTIRPRGTNAVNPSGRDKAEEHLIINHTPKRGLGSSLSFLSAEGTDEEQTDGIVATETIRLLETHHDQPFFIAAGFYRPHCPYIAPKKYFDLYPIEQVTIPTGPWDYLANVPPRRSPRPSPIPGLA